MRIPFIAGNWKMYKTRAEAEAFARTFKELYHDTDVNAAICAPYTALDVLVREFKDTGILVGAQNVFYEKEGAFTGEISVEMLKEIGVDLCIVGHSERRQYFAETDSAVNLKIKALQKAGIRPVLCVGENLDEREKGLEKDIVGRQVTAAFEGIEASDAAGVIVAYEPVWAIGTGKTATAEQANDMCSLIRNILIEMYDEETADEVIIQYGGSVKPENATELMNMDEIDGALVGGASLDPAKFIEIVNF